MLADQVDHVIGVDTHCDSHELAVVAASSGGVVARSSQRANPRGYAEAIRFAAAHAPGRRVWAIEGSGHYGAGLARYLALHGEAIVEVGRMPRSGQRLEGKDDRLDALLALLAPLWAASSSLRPAPASAAKHCECCSRRGAARSRFAVSH
jgi:hypothetical protein